MLPNLRQEFNARFTEEKFAKLRARLNQRTRTEISVAVCETPVFLPPELTQTMINAGTEIVQQLLSNADYMKASDAAIPDAFRVPGEEDHPQFLQVDFGLVRNANGELEPRLVELQGFPSVYGYQHALAEEYIAAYDLDPALQIFLDGMDVEGYWSLLRECIVAGHDPENVVLMEVDPENQKTVMDFRLHEDHLGIRTVDIAKVRKEGRRLLYEHSGRWIPINRVYNRAIVDEMVQRQVKTGFDLRDDLEIEWAGHPNWYFRLSKFSLPWIDHPFVPPAVFLGDFELDRAGLSADQNALVLKPLYSFAGKGIQFAPTLEEINAIHEEDGDKWLLQNVVRFEPVVSTPLGMTQVEVRIMYAWPQDGTMRPVNTLIRLGRGKMMGVDHNKGLRWVGGSAGLLPT